MASLKTLGCIFNKAWRVKRVSVVRLKCWRHRLTCIFLTFLHAVRTNVCRNFCLRCVWYVTCSAICKSMIAIFLHLYSNSDSLPNDGNGQSNVAISGFYHAWMLTGASIHLLQLMNYEVTTMNGLPPRRPWSPMLSGWFAMHPHQLCKFK